MNVSPQKIIPAEHKASLSILAGSCFCSSRFPSAFLWRGQICSFPQFLWEATLSNQTSIDDKDVFAFQNDMRYKRITWLMNMARFYPPIYHLITSTSITGRHTTQRLMFSCLNSSDLILVKKRKEKKKKLNVVWSAEYICGECAHMLTPWWRGSLACKQLHLRGKEQLVEKSIFMIHNADGVYSL